MSMPQHKHTQLNVSNTAHIKQQQQPASHYLLSQLNSLPKNMLVLSSNTEQQYPIHNVVYTICTQLKLKINVEKIQTTKSNTRKAPNAIKDTLLAEESSHNQVQLKQLNLNFRLTKRFRYSRIQRCNNISISVFVFCVSWY